jgi:hypothetical protein
MELVIQQTATIQDHRQRFATRQQTKLLIDETDNCCSSFKRITSCRYLTTITLSPETRRTSSRAWGKNHPWVENHSPRSTYGFGDVQWYLLQILSVHNIITRCYTWVPAKHTSKIINDFQEVSYVNEFWAVNTTYQITCPEDTHARVQRVTFWQYLKGFVCNSVNIEAYFRIGSTVKQEK